MTEEQTESSIKNCFVVMPFGRESAERRWFKGWYKVVIEPAVLATGYEPILAAAEEQPGAINDEIRSHLVYDPMVVVDLGGVDVDEDPNPNVMYELGIRHALGLPLVIMAWEGQRLPFDISNQRVIMEPRDFLAQETNRKKLVSFINAADEGRFYRPMDAVGRMATIDAVSATLGEESILNALVQEIKDLRGTVASVAYPRHPRVSRASKPTIKRLLKTKAYRKELYPHFIECGGANKVWPKVLKTEVSEQFIEDAERWTEDDWKVYIEKRAKEPVSQQKPLLSNAMVSTEQVNQPLSEELIGKVLAELPKQPWPTGTHKIVQEKLGISSKVCRKAVDELINRGNFKMQIDGVLVDSDCNSHETQ